MSGFIGAVIIRGSFVWKASGEQYCQREVAAKVIWVVTVKEPITGPLRNPRNGSRVTRIKTFGNNHVALRIFVINNVALTIAATVDAEVKTMKVQRVAFESSIDPTPVHWLTLSVS